MLQVSAVLGSYKKKQRAVCRKSVCGSEVGIQ